MNHKHKTYLIITLFMIFLSIICVIKITKNQTNPNDKHTSQNITPKVENNKTTSETEKNQNNESATNSDSSIDKKFNNENSKIDIIDQSTIKESSAKNTIVKLSKEDYVITPFEKKGNIIEKRNDNNFITINKNQLSIYDPISKKETLLYEPMPENSLVHVLSNNQWLVFSEVPSNEVRVPKNWKMYAKNIDSGEIISIDKNSLDKDTNLPDMQSYMPYSLAISEDNKLVYNKKYFNKDNLLVSGVICYDLNSKSNSILYEETDINEKGLGRISISNNIVVWERVYDYDETETLVVKYNHSDIFAYDLLSKKLVQITDKKYCSWPMIYNDNVVYTVFDLKTQSGNQKIFMYNIKDNTNKEIVGDNVPFKDNIFCYLGNIHNERYMTWTTNRNSFYIYDIKEDKFLDVSNLLTNNFDNVSIKVFRDNVVYISYVDKNTNTRSNILFKLKN